MIVSRLVLRGGGLRSTRNVGSAAAHAVNALSRKRYSQGDDNNGQSKRSHTQRTFPWWKNSLCALPGTAQERQRMAQQARAHLSGLQKHLESDQRPVQVTFQHDQAYCRRVRQGGCWKPPKQLSCRTRRTESIRTAQACALTVPAQNASMRSLAAPTHHGSLTRHPSLVARVVVATGLPGDPKGVPDPSIINTA